MGEKYIRIEIEYCKGCRWLTRASWLAQELLITFENELASVSLVPSSEAGTFCVRSEAILFWDRKAEGGFPDLKELKQRIRDVVDPVKDLGHSDRKCDKQTGEL